MADTSLDGEMGLHFLPGLAPCLSHARGPSAAHRHRPSERWFIFKWGSLLSSPIHSNQMKSLPANKEGTVKRTEVPAGRARPVWTFPWSLFHLRLPSLLSTLPRRLGLRQRRQSSPTASHVAELVQVCGSSSCDVVGRPVLVANSWRAPTCSFASLFVMLLRLLLTLRGAHFFGRITEVYCSHSSAAHS